jgi:hypothetical protein
MIPGPEPAPETAPAPDRAVPGSDEGIAALVGDVRQLAADAKNLAEAELAFQVSRARVAGEAARNIAIYGLVAAVLAFFALSALTVGLLLALTPLVTAWGATAIVVGGLVLAAMACVMAAAARVRRLLRALGAASRKPGA